MRRAQCSRSPVTCAVRYAAELEVFSPRQGSEDFDRAPLQLEVTLGQCDFKESPAGIDVGFTLRFRRVILALFLEDAELARDGRYNRVLHPDVFKRLFRRTMDASEQGEKELSGGFSMGLHRILSALNVDLDSRFKLVEEFKRGNFDAVEGAPPYALVRYASGQRWEIGHAVLGDPSQLDGILHGSYFSAKEGSEDEAYIPVCYVTPTGDKPYAITVELRAGLRDCVYSPIGAVRSEARWMQRNRERIEKRLVAKMLQEQNRRDGYDPPADEIILARGRIEFSRMEPEVELGAAGD